MRPETITITLTEGMVAALKAQKIAGFADTLENRVLMVLEGFQADYEHDQFRASEDEEDIPF